MRVRTHNDLNQWLKFFMRGVIETARKGVETFDKILQLQKHTESKIKELGTKGKDADRVIDFLYRTPVIDAQKVAEVTGKSLKTAYELIVRMEDLRILKEITGAFRGKLYVFKDYLNLFY